MSSVRRLIVAFGFGIGFWVLASFAGAMLDPAHAEPWTTSLMWSLLVSTLVAPAFLVAYHHGRREPGRREARGWSRGPRRADAGRKTDPGEATSFIEETPSVAEEVPSEQRTALWPEPQDPETRPADGHEDAGDWPQVREDVGAKRAA
jgi:hypothetical protein